MRLTMPRRGVGVCVGACLTVGAFLLMAGAAWAESTLSLCLKLINRTKTPIYFL